MNETEVSLVEAADRFAEEKHRGQKDKAGKPYIEHPRAVAALVSGELEKTVALLHDTVEDTDASIQEIRQRFGDTVADAVDCMTHREGVPYMEYIAKIAQNPLARMVKLADLTHNMDLTRIPHPTEKDFERIEKYRKAFAFLKEAEDTK